MTTVEILETVNIHRFVSDRVFQSINYLKLKLSVRQEWS